DHLRYVGLFPTVTEAKLLPTNSFVQQARYRIQVPVPIALLSFDQKVVMQHQYHHNRLTTLIIDSPIQHGLGQFEWFELPNGKTLVTLTQWGDLNAPKGFIVTTLLRALPELKLGIPNGVGAFVLESIRRRFDPDPTLGKVYPLEQLIPTHHLNERQQQQVKRLIQHSGQPVVFSHPAVWLRTSKRPEKMFFSTSYARIHATPKHAFDTLSDPKRYRHLFKQIKKVNLTPATQGTNAHIRVGLGLGVITIPYHVKLNIQQPTPQTAVFHANGGDIEFFSGRIHLSAWDERTSLAQMTSGGKLGDDAPFLLSIGKSLPYADLLPSIGAAPIILERANRYFDTEKR
ncbi:MAG: SRPBCC family protein, partial [Pseudomonadota bacterium]|nr:SRPBCC family protein [Pseudomonadota bacterium]